MFLWSQQGLVEITPLDPIMAQDKAQTGEVVVRRRHGDTKRSQSWNPGIRTLPFFIAYPVGPGPHLLVAGPGRESSDYGLLSSDPSASLLPPLALVTRPVPGLGNRVPLSRLHGVCKAVLRYRGRPSPAFAQSCF